MMCKPFLLVLYFCILCCTTLSAWDFDIVAWGGGVRVADKLPTRHPVSVFGGNKINGKKISSISSGTEHSLALTVDGTVFSWGSNGKGQLGDGTTTQNFYPASLNASNWDGKTITQVLARADQSFVLTSDGTLFAWGENSLGQLGVGTTTQQNSPVQINFGWDGRRVTKIDAGARSTMALTSDDNVYMWGANDNNVLGAGNIIESTPRLIAKTWAGKTVSMIACGYMYALLLTTDGTIYAWGRGSEYQLGLDTNQDRSVPEAISSATFNSKPISFIAARIMVSFAITIDGSVYSWGRGDYGFLGHGSTAAKPVPTMISNSFWQGKNITEIYAKQFIIAMASDGTVFTWGQNSLATGNTGTCSLMSPCRVLSESLSNVTSIFVGDDIVYAVAVPVCSGTLATNSSVCSGHGSCTFQENCVCEDQWIHADCSIPTCYGKVETENTKCSRTNGRCLGPNTCTCFEDFYGDECQYFNSTTCSNSRHPFAVKMWGSNEYFQCGLFAPESAHTSTPWPINDELWRCTTPSKIVSGYSHVLVLSSTGELFAWGANDFGQIAISSQLAKIRPQPVLVRNSFWNGSSIVDIAVGSQFSLAVTSTGSVYAWGINLNDGRLGLGSSFLEPSYSQPMQISDSNWSGKKIVKIAAGFAHALSLSTDGTVFAWGDGSVGQLGDGTSSNFDTPQMLASTLWNGKQIAAIAAGDFHSLALATDGTVFAWGSNEFGQLGDNLASNMVTPYQLDNNSWLGKQIVSIAAGAYHSLALSADGTVWAWGYNSNGMLGDGTRVDMTQQTMIDPTKFDGKRVVSIAAAPLLSMAITDDGTLYGWGNPDHTETEQPLLVPTVLLPGENVTLVGSGGYNIIAMTSPRVCFGISATDPLVCNGNGVCRGNGSCECNSLREERPYGYILQRYNDSKCETLLAPEYYISKNITEQVRLNESNVYQVIQPIAILQTMEIEPGTTLFMHSGTSILVEGLLVAQGNSTHSITFRNVEASAWGSITFLPSVSRSIMAYVTISGGGHNAKATLIVKNRSLVLSRARIDGCNSWGVYACGTTWFRSERLTGNCAHTLEVYSLHCEE